MLFANSDSFLGEQNLVRTHIGNVTPHLILSAVIPLKDGCTISESHAETLARHVELYLQHNPEEVSLIKAALDGQSIQTALDFEMMLEYDQRIRTVLLRAVATIASKSEAEFVDGLDRSRLASLVKNLEQYPAAYQFGDGGSYSSV